MTLLLMYKVTYDTVWPGAGLPCRRLSACCRIWTEISAIRWATSLLCATSEQQVRRSILSGGWAACMEFTWHCTIADCLQRTPEDAFIFPSRVRPRRICDIYDFFAPHINALTYLLTIWLTTIVFACMSIGQSCLHFFQLFITRSTPYTLPITLSRR